MGNRSVICYANDTDIHVITVQHAAFLHWNLPQVIRQLVVDEMKLPSTFRRCSFEELFINAADKVFSTIAEYDHVDCVNVRGFDNDSGYQMLRRQNLLLSYGDYLNTDETAEPSLSTLESPAELADCRETHELSEDISSIVSEHDHQQDGVGSYYTEGETVIHFYTNSRYIHRGKKATVSGLPWKDSYSLDDCIEQIVKYKLVSDDILKRYGLLEDSAVTV